MKAPGAEVHDEPLAPVTVGGLEEPTFELLGEPFVRTLEEPGLRLKFPTGIAEAMGSVLVVFLAETEKRKWLTVFPVARWRGIMRDTAHGKPEPGQDKQALLRRLAANAARVELSRDGRLTLPKSLAARCGIVNEVTAWPRVDRVEIVAGRKLPTKADEDRLDELYHGFEGGVPGLL